MNAHVARCQNCAVAVGAVFHISGHPSADDRALIAWWRTKGLRVDVACVLETEFVPGTCTCTTDTQRIKAGTT